MRLVLLFDETIGGRKLRKDDIVLTNNSNFQFEGKSFFFDVSSLDEDPSVSISTKGFFKSISENAQVLINRAYSRIFRSLTSLINNVEEIVARESIDEIVLVGGSSWPFFTMKHGEGEGNKYFYKSSWLMCPIVFSKYKDQITIRWFKRTPSIIMRMFHFIRENIFVFKEILNTKKHEGKESNEAFYPSQDELSRSAVVFIQKKLQYLPILKIMSNVKKLTPIYASQSHDVEGINVFYIWPYSGKYFTDVIKRTLKEKIAKCDGVFEWNGILVTIKKRVISRIMRPDLLATLRSVEPVFSWLDKLDYKPQYMISNMTYGSELNKLHIECKKRAIKHINFQYASMAKMLYPEMELADRYYLYTKKVKDLYSKFSSSYRLYLPPAECQANVLGNKVSVTVFLQPDWYADRYAVFLRLLCAIITDRGIELDLLIKPHYRQNKMELFENIAQEYSFVNLLEKKDSVADIMRKTNIMMSMTSSVLFEAVLECVPGLIIDIDGRDSKLIDNSDVCVQEVNFRCNSMDGIINYIVNAPETLSEYEKRRNSYLISNRGLVDMEEAFF